LSLLDLNDERGDEKPLLSILGVYSLSADMASYARFIRELIDSHDPPNFSEEVKDVLRVGGRGNELWPLTPEERQDLESELRFYIDNAAVLEVLVKNPDLQFNPMTSLKLTRSTLRTTRRWRGTRCS